MGFLATRCGSINLALIPWRIDDPTREVRFALMNGRRQLEPSGLKSENALLRLL